MTWKGRNPVVTRISAIYETGVKLSKDAMRELEAKLQRLPKLGKWFVNIVPGQAALLGTSQQFEEVSVPERT